MKIPDSLSSIANSQALERRRASNHWLLQAGQGGQVEKKQEARNVCIDQRPYSSHTNWVEPGSTSDRNQKKLKGLRILIADDCLIGRLVVGEALRNAGADEVCVFDSGFGVIGEVVRRDLNHFDAVILDIQMPGMDGIETATQLRNIAPQLLVVALSADSNLTTRARAHDAGMVAYLEKPVSENVLVSILTNTQGSLEATDAVGAIDHTESPVFAIERLRRRFKHRDNLVMRLVKLFWIRHQKTPENLSRAIASEDWGTVHQIAHTLKGMAGHILANDLFAAAQKVCGDIQRHGRTEQRKATHMLEALVTLVHALKELPDESRSVQNAPSINET